MNIIEEIPSHIIAEILLKLSNNNRIAFLTAFPGINVNWGVLYNRENNLIQKGNNLIQKGLDDIYDKYFPESKENRMNAMKEYYDWFKPHKHSYDYYDEYDYAHIKEKYRIPIIYTGRYKVEDYEYDITDYIYKDIYDFKAINKKDGDSDDSDDGSDDDDSDDDSDES
jgi:hypothetical protein